LTATPTEAAEPAAFLLGGGQMGALIRAHDWTRTPLGPPVGWPQALRTTVRLALSTRHPVFIFWGPELTCLYNDAYSATIGPELHPWALGRPGREVWDETWDIIGPQINLVMSGRGATWHEDHLVPITRHGQRKNVRWTYSYSPIDDDGAPQGVGGVLVLCNDVTGAHLAREALRESEARFRTLMDTVPAIVWVTEADGCCSFLNRRWYELTGQTEAEALGLGWLGATHPEDQAETKRAFLASVERQGSFRVEYRLRRADGSYIWAIDTAEPRLGPDATYLGHVGVVLDISERREAEKRQTLLAREVDHRAKNALAVVQAALRLTPKKDPEAYARVVEGRVRALARAHSMLAEARWGGTELHALLEGELAPFLAGQRAELSGPPVALPAPVAQALAMAVHELATNAVKHGALSAPCGRISVSWRLDRGEAAPRLSLHWSEAGGPAIEGPPDRRGFGSRVLEAVLRTQLGGSVSMVWNPVGLVCEIEVPLRTHPADAAFGWGLGAGATG
jgi:PAS domain S-box-containing protein